MTPEEFRIELDKLPLVINLHEGCYAVHLEGSGSFVGLRWGKGPIASILAQVYNAISKDVRFTEELSRIENLMSTVWQEGSKFCNRARPNVRPEELFERDFSWFKEVFPSKLSSDYAVHFDFWEIEVHEYRVVLPTGPLGTCPKPAEILTEYPAESYEKEVRKDNKVYRQHDAIIAFVGYSAKQYEVRKCVNTTPTIRALMVWVAIGSKPKAIILDSLHAYHCLFEPNDASRAWFKEKFPDEHYEPRWETLTKDEVHTCLVFTKFLMMPH